AQNCYLIRKFFGRLVLPASWVQTTAVFALTFGAMLVLQRWMPVAAAGALACGAFAGFGTWTLRGISQSHEAIGQKP
ncbi:MAG TPA: hypothetical protein VJ723_15500, partial [Candidatus Angelobacter sp.]|nr:hypothetical protein [Candidatus Angelobacter sp.]